MLNTLVLSTYLDGRARLSISNLNEILLNRTQGHQIIHASTSMIYQITLLLLWICREQDWNPVNQESVWAKLESSKVLRIFKCGELLDKRNVYTESFSSYTEKRNIQELKVSVRKNFENSHVCRKKGANRPLTVSKIDFAL